MERNWKKISGFDFKEILFEEYNHIAKITINRERYRNAFTPLTTWEMSQAFAYCRECADIRVVILTGAGDKAFCSGGDCTSRAVVGMWAMMVCLASMCSMCRCRFADYPNPS